MEEESFVRLQEQALVRLAALALVSILVGNKTMRITKDLITGNTLYGTHFDYNGCV